MTGTFEYVSPEWLEAVAAIIAALLQRIEPEAFDYCICEDLTNPPAGRANTPAGTLSWFIRFQNGDAEIGAGSADAPDLRIVADYATHHELSRQVWAGNPEIIAESRRRRELATADGRLRFEGNLGTAPTAVLDLVARLHDPVAAITI